MSDAAIGNDGKVSPETLELRSRPRPVTRFKRGVVVTALGGTALMVFGAAWLALGEEPKPVRAVGQELYNTDRKPTADGLAQVGHRLTGLSRVTLKCGQVF